MSWLLQDAVESIVDRTLGRWVDRNVTLVRARRRLRTDHRLACVVLARTHPVADLGSAWCRGDALLEAGILTFTATAGSGVDGPVRLEVCDVAVVPRNTMQRPKQSVLRVTVLEGEVDCAVRAELAEQAAALLRPPSA